MLLVDDAHDLDDASAALLHLMSASDRVFSVVTVRSGERSRGVADFFAAKR